MLGGGGGGEQLLCFKDFQMYTKSSYTHVHSCFNVFLVRNLGE